MCLSTELTLWRDPRLETVSAADAWRLDMLRRLTSLETDGTVRLDERVLRRVLKCSSAASLHNCLARLSTARLLAGEIGALTLPAWLLPTAAQETVVASAQTSETAPQSRRPYPADDRWNEQRREQRNGGEPGAGVVTPNYANPSRRSTPETTPHAGAQKPEPVPATVPDSYKKPEPAAGTGPEPDDADAGGEIVAAFVLVGMEAQRAKERVQEFGVSRCRDALDALRYRQSKEPVESPVGFLTKFLVDNWTLPGGVYSLRERERKAQITAQKLAEQEAARQASLAEGRRMTEEALALQATIAAQRGDGHVHDLGTLSPGTA